MSSPWPAPWPAPVAGLSAGDRARLASWRWFARLVGAAGVALGLWLVVFGNVDIDRPTPPTNCGPGAVAVLLFGPSHNVDALSATSCRGAAASNLGVAAALVVVAAGFALHATGTGRRGGRYVATSMPFVLGYALVTTIVAFLAAGAIAAFDSGAATVGLLLATPFVVRSFRIGVEIDRTMVTVRTALRTRRLPTERVVALTEVPVRTPLGPAASVSVMHTAHDAAVLARMLAVPPVRPFDGIARRRLQAANVALQQVHSAM